MTENTVVIHKIGMYMLIESTYIGQSLAEIQNSMILYKF